MKTSLLFLFILCTAGLPLQSIGQISAPDTLLMQHYQAQIEKTMFTDRQNTLRYCDSMGLLANRMNWAEKQVEILLIRTENANIFIDIEGLSCCLLQLEQSLHSYKNRLSEAAYTRFQEEKDYLWGRLYFQKGNLVKALAIYLDLRKKLLGKSSYTADVHLRLFIVTQLLARTYISAGDYQKAIDYYLLSIERRAGFPKKTMHYVNALYQIGDIYQKQGQIEKSAGSYLLSLDSLNKAIRADGPDKWAFYAVNLHRRLGFHYANRELYKLAFEHFDLALAYMKPENPYIVDIHDNMGVTYGKINQPEKALEHLHLSLNLKRKMYGENSEKTAETLLFIGEVYQQQGDYATALTHCQKALGILCNEPLDTNGHNNSFKNPIGRQQLYLTGLSQKSNVLYHLYRQNPARVELLDATQETLQIARQLMEKMRGEYIATSDKQFLMDDSRSLYERSIACELLRQRSLTQSGQAEASRDPLQGYRQAFLLTEKTKSLLLYEGTQNTWALRYSGIPDALLQQEYDLRVDIAWYDKERFDLENNGKPLTDSVLLTLNRHLFDLRHDSETLQKTFETDYPDYYRLKYDLRTEDITSVQRDLLDPDQALVEYFVGDSSIFIFRVGKIDFEVQEIKKDFPLEQWVAQLRTGLTAFHVNARMSNKYDSLSMLYANAAAKIYEKLIAPVAAKLPPKVIFIPDGVLGYVPYEVLLAEKPENPARWNTHHYLLNDHQISYCYSATMLREMKQRQHKQQPVCDFIGFAPAYNGDTALLASTFQYAGDLRKDLKPLPHSGEEVYRAAKIMKGQVFVGAEASTQKFAEQAGKAKILHLATHGQANDQAGDYCFLVFAQSRGDSKSPRDLGSDALLYARDLYNLQLNADLVTLSACETGIGELQGGEGIISLARAFAYAGAKSIVTSLWSVSDAKTKDLMVDFYKNLRKGMPKDAALQQAKLDFLKRNKGVAAHPFYWAGFVGIGDMEKIK